MSAAQSGGAPVALLRQRLSALAERGMLRREYPLGGSPESATVRLGEHALLLLASNDYLGLAGHPRLVAAAHEALDGEGTSASASRLISGTRHYHKALEARIAEFCGSEAAAFFSTGYTTNLGLITALARQGDFIVADERNHASLIDACRLTHATRRVYAHNDVAEAERYLAEAPAGALKLLVTDGVFSMDGDQAPLGDLLEIARKHQALFVVDDSHAVGVLGERGRGSLDALGIAMADDIVLVGTFSKALGGHGGFVAAAQPVVDAIVQAGRSYLFSTAPPPAQVAVAAEALVLVDAEPWRRAHLRALEERFRAGVTAAGLALQSRNGPILPVLVGEAAKAAEAAEALRERGVFVTAIRPPTVPDGTCRLRFTLSARLSLADVDRAVAIVTAVLGEQLRGTTR
jgi:8-amino-7-oxononanoate synthase